MGTISMWKLLIFLFVLSMAIVSIGGYQYLNGKITEGEKQLLAGQQQFAQGQQLLRAGKAKLAAGRQKLASFKRVHRTFKNIPLFGITPIGLVAQGAVSGAGQQVIASGEQKVRKGSSAVAAGEKRLSEGALQLKQGIEKLNHAKSLRKYCSIGVTIFILLTIALGIYWRQFLFQLIKFVKCK